MKEAPIYSLPARDTQKLTEAMVNCGKCNGSFFVELETALTKRALTKLVEKTFQGCGLPEGHPYFESVYLVSPATRVWRFTDND